MDWRHAVVEIAKEFARHVAMPIRLRPLSAVCICEQRLLPCNCRRARELQKIHEDQREMMVDISHRLQLPLAAVRSELELLKQGRISAKHIEACERSINGMSKFVCDLLRLARLGVEGECLQKERFDISAALRELMECFEIIAEDRDIALEFQIAPALCIVGNRDYIEEMVTNLVSNAFKYLDPKREQKVRIFLTEDRSHAAISVIDSGRGIAPEELGKIFDRFYRVRQPAAMATSGSGLGLAIAKKIAENHRGEIRVTSELNKGTEVLVRLPLQMLGAEGGT